MSYVQLDNKVLKDTSVLTWTANLKPAIGL